MSKILIGKYEATIYPERGGYTGAISLGFDGKGNRQRIKKKGRTKAAVRDKLVQVVAARETGLKPTVLHGGGCGQRLARQGTQGPRRGHRDDQPHPRRAASDPAHRCDQAQGGADRRRRGRLARRAHGKLSTRSLQGVHAILKRAIRQAQARDKVLGNVAELVTTPKGKGGTAQPGHDARTGHSHAGASQGVTAARVCRREPAHRHPHRRGPRAAVVSCRGVGRR